MGFLNLNLTGQAQEIFNNAPTMHGLEVLEADQRGTVRPHGSQAIGLPDVGVRAYRSARAATGPDLHWKPGNQLQEVR